MAATTTHTNAEAQHRVGISKHITFTTIPKLRRLTFHKQPTVRNRVHALQESFWPDTDVSYAAVRRRMVTLLGVCDKKSVVAYLGRPSYETVQKISHTKKYQNSGKTIPLTHTLRRKLPGKLGYIQLFDLGSVYSVEGNWFIHWNHTKQLTLPNLSDEESSPRNPPSPSSLDESTQQKRSNVLFSLSLKASKYDKHETDNKRIVTVDSSSSLNREERKTETESKQHFPITQHSKKVKLNALEKSILRISKEADPNG